MNVDSALDETPCEVLLRRFERDVLDVHHRALPLWARSPAQRLWGILVGLDSFILSRFAAQESHGVLPLGLAHRFKTIEEGVNYALTWCYAESSGAFPHPVESETLLDEGGSFLLFCADYFVIADLHQMYGRGAMAIECSADERRIRFVPVRTSNVLPWHVMAEYASVEQSSARHNAEVVRAISRKWKDIHFELGAGRVVLTNIDDLRRTGLIDDVRPLCEESTLPLDESESLGGVTVGDFRAAWQVLLAWSMAAVQIYLQGAAADIPQSTCMPTQVVPRQHLVSALSGAGGVSPEAAEQVVEMLTYRPASKRPDIFLQPLIASADRRMIAWSPHVVRMSRPERNALKLLAREPQTSNLAANLIGGRERRLAEEFG
jgi:hypothetical protein